MDILSHNLPFPAEEKRGNKRRILANADHIVSLYMAGKRLRPEGPGAYWQLRVQGEGSMDRPF
jgi:hypothetical protein